MTAQQTRKSASHNKSAAKPARRPTRRTDSRSHLPEVPGWTATIASVVGVGVAVGVGLYATRRQWLPKAEAWGEDLNERFGDLKEKYSGQAHNDHEDDGAEDWDDDTGLSDASYPVARPAA